MTAEAASVRRRAEAMATIRLRGPAMLRRFVVAGLLSGASLAMIAVVASAA